MASEMFTEDGIVRLADFAVNKLELLCKGKAQDLEHSIEGILKLANGREDVSAVEIIPVLEIGHGLEEIGRE